MSDMTYWWERISVSPSEKNNIFEFMNERGFTWEVKSVPCFALIDGKYVEVDRHRVCV
jgi:hypothetical protein